MMPAKKDYGALRRLWLVWLRFRHRKKIAEAKVAGDEYVKEMGW